MKIKSKTLFLAILFLAVASHTFAQLPSAGGNPELAVQHAEGNRVKLALRLAKTAKIRAALLGNLNPWASLPRNESPTAQTLANTANRAENAARLLKLGVAEERELVRKLVKAGASKTVCNDHGGCCTVLTEADGNALWSQLEAQEGAADAAIPRIADFRERTAAWLRDKQHDELLAELRTAREAAEDAQMTAKNAMARAVQAQRAAADAASAASAPAPMRTR